jgi:hypothetical protein
MLIVPINVRKLAALDMAFHGPKLIIGEFAIGVCLPLGLGVLSLFRGHARWQSFFGIYMLFLALSYLPLLIHAIFIARKGRVRQEVEAELASGRDELMRYQRQMFWLLVPLVVPALAIMQLSRDQDKSG